jgi:hypothetical protein
MESFAVLLSLLLSCHVHAQPATAEMVTKTHYLLLGLGYDHETIFDEAISGLRYQRGGLMPDLGYLRMASKNINRVQLYGSSLKLQSDQRSDLIASTVSSTEFGFDYDHLRLFKSPGKNWRWYLGGRASLLFDLKQAPQLDNSSLLYDYAMSLGASTAFTKQWAWEKRNPWLMLQLSVPLLAHITRPPYLNRIEFLDVKNELLSDMFSNSEITSLHGFFRVQTAAEFYYPIRDGDNLLRLSYRWDYYRMKTFNRIFHGEQQLVFSFLMNI